MDQQPHMPIEPPTLTDEAASQLLEFLYDLLTAFENHYGHQLRRYQEPDELPQYDLFDNDEEENPPF
jgi:hypothetical protein